MSRRTRFKHILILFFGLLVSLWVAEAHVEVDLNADGCVDRADYNLLMAAVRARSTDLQFDLNGDGVVSRADARTLVNAFTNPRGAACAPDNQPPEFDPIDDPTVAENESLEFTVTASDPDGHSV